MGGWSVFFFSWVSGIHICILSAYLCYVLERLLEHREGVSFRKIARARNPEAYATAVCTLDGEYDGDSHARNCAVANETSTLSAKATATKR